MPYRVLARFDEEDNVYIRKKHSVGGESSLDRFKLTIDELIILGNMARHEKVRRQDVGIWKKWGVSEVVKE